MYLRHNPHILDIEDEEKEVNFNYKEFIVKIKVYTYFLEI